MIILHCVNFCWVGGIGNFVSDFAKAFNEFEHHILFLNDNKEQYNYYKYFQARGIRAYYAPEITEELIDKINPKIICLHNPYPDKIKDLNILQKYYTIQFYHNKCRIFPHINLHIFVSDWISNQYKGYEKFIKK